MIDKSNIYFNRLEFIKNKKKTNIKILYKDQNNIRTNIELDNVLPKKKIVELYEKIKNKKLT